MKRERLVLVVLGFIGALALCGQGRADEVYLGENEAPAAVLTDAERFERLEIASTGALRARIRELLGNKDPTVFEPRYVVYEGYRDGERVGWAIIVEEVGKHRNITFIVGVRPGGKVAGVAIMVYREAYGAEVRSKRFLSQYEGKTAADPLMPGRDIRNIAGATLSARALGRGIKKALAVAELLEGRAPPAERPAEEPNRPPDKSEPGAHDGSGARVREAHYVMGTTLEITLDAPDRRTGQTWIREAVAIARRLDREMTTYDGASDLMRLNAAAGTGPQRVPPDLYAALRLALVLWQETNGLFDIAAPAGAANARAAALRDHAPALPSVVRLGEDGSVELATGDVRLDLGGIGKGYAADRMAEHLRARGIDSALIDFGRSSLVAIGPPVGENPWPVTVVHQDEVVGVLALRDRAVSVSASYQPDDGGGRRPHIVDPRTGAFVGADREAIVLDDSAGVAEAWSTALVVEPGAIERLGASHPTAAALVLEGATTRTLGTLTWLESPEPRP